MVSVLTSVEPRILSDLARCTFETEVPKLTDGDILGAVQKKCSSLLKAQAPDVEELIKQQLNMHLRERGIDARLMKNFMDLDLIVEENGLSELFGCDQLFDAADDYARKENRCKLLIDNLAPAILKTDIKRLVSIQLREAKTNDVTLRKLILQRATEQQHFHLHQEEKPEGAKKTQPGEHKDVKPGERKDAMRKEQVSQKPKKGKHPPLSGCLICTGSHWVSECPTATDGEKLAARQKMWNRPNDENRAKAIKSAGADCNGVTR
ncbi:hypothetical protein FI667_g14060, partial [Globisporangium splendens]